MDITTIIGFLVGVTLIYLSIMGDMWAFYSPSSMGVVIGGSLAATLISLPMRRAISLPRVALKAIRHRPVSARRVIEDLVRFGEIARRDGILALEKVLGEIDDRFLAEGIQMAVDGSDPETIYETMSTELDCMKARHTAGRDIFDTLGKYAPAFGMIGTLIGMIMLLKNLDDPDKIGPGMATALITTFYGVIVANLLAIPVAEKLMARSRDEMVVKDIIIHGVMAIQSGDNPRILEQKLKIFLPPEERRGR